MAADINKRNVVVLFHLIKVISVVSGLAIILLAAFGMHNLFSRHVIGVAEKEAILLGQLLTEQQKDVLFVKEDSGVAILEIAPAYQQWFDQNVREFLPPFDILKIKIFSPDGRIIYSTDKTIIGDIDPSNPRLQKALRGEIDAHLENKDSLRHMRNESNFNVDVVETYTPIIAEDEVLGAIELYVDVTQLRKEIQAGTVKSLLLLTSILVVVSLIAFTIARGGMKQLAEAEEKLLAQATLDALTGVFNRAELMNRASDELSRNDRLRAKGTLTAEFCLVMLDIDHFKRINDEYGHLAGDAILHQLAQRIRKSLRPYDLMGRYGGEEFLLLLPHTGLENAGCAAERILAAIENTPFTYQDTELMVSISLGVGAVIEGLSLNDIIDRADQALYQAKQKGRNRVDFFLSPVPELDRFS